jgi:hypothetical protein
MATKKAAKHTPGPWEVKTHPLCILTAGRRPIADVMIQSMGDTRGVEYEECFQRALADAALIAAAPELLDQLKGALRLLEAQDEDGVMIETIAPIRAAIAKATGQEGK